MVYREILRLEFNWSQVQGGEDYEIRTTGKSGVRSIIEHAAAGEGDHWYYDVVFVDGTMERLFNPNRVIYGPEKEMGWVNL